MDDPDLHALRTFRASEATPPEGLQSRIEERLWQSILDEEAVRAGRSDASSWAGESRARRRTWFHGLLRPALAASSALAIAAVVAIASDGGPSSLVGTSGTGSAAQASTSLLDATASSLFGDDAAAPSATSSGTSGVVDLSDSGTRDALVDGPSHDDAGDFVDAAPRDPAMLRAELRAAAADVVGRDTDDRVAFHIGMQWVIDTDVDVSLRAAMVRAVGGLSGIEPVLAGVDLLGRDAVAIGHVDTVSGVREQYLLDPDNGRLLERLGRTVSYVDPACDLGTVTDHVLLDDAGHEVEPSDAPWLAWPQVIAACAPGVTTG